MVLLSGCNASMTDQSSVTREGLYEIVFDLGEVQCPTRWEISEDGITIINAEERIQVSEYHLFGDSASFVLPVFGTTVDFHFILYAGSLEINSEREIIKWRLRGTNLKNSLIFKKNQIFNLRMMSL